MKIINDLFFFHYFVMMYIVRDYRILEMNNGSFDSYSENIQNQIIMYPI